MNEIIVSQHAAERFVERSRKNGMAIPKDPKKTILKLLSLAKEDVKMPSWRKVERLISHRDAKYYTTHGWRFILDGDRNMVLTVERERADQN